MIVFGTGIAALLCLGVGVLAVVSGIGITSLLAQDGDAGRALGVTMATAGRAIAFSGMTVALGLAGLLFFSGTSLVSMGAAGAIVVVISVVFGLTFLPALLAILGVRVNRLSVPIFQPRPFGKGAWHRIATWVMRRPWFVLLRYVNVAPAIGIGGYQALYQQPRASWPASVQQAASTSTGSSIAVFDAATPYLTTSDQAHSLVRAIRAHGAVTGATVQVTGNTAFDLDFVGYMVGHIPLVVAFVAVATLAVLLLLLRSVVLPLKAVLMNALSLSAAFGALVWVFQDGHLSGLLGFTPGPLDPTIPVLLFCIVFGLSMDYEVFLLTRMQEEWRRTEDNRTAVAGGLERSGRLVTGAALIMACIFIAFGLASVVTIKALGLGMAIAVVVDATLVRALVVPAPMRLLGRANWWSPRWRQRRRVLEDQRAAAA